MINETGFERADFQRAYHDASSWRGQCIATFARAERAATEALIRLATRHPQANLPHLVGQKFDALLRMLAVSDDPAAAAASKMLAAFQAHDDLRRFLCHGEPKVTLDSGGRWHLVLTLVSLKCGRASTSVLVVEEREAVDIARSLQRDQQRFSSRITCVAAAKAEPPVALRIGQVGQSAATARTIPADRAE